MQQRDKLKERAYNQHTYMIGTKDMVYGWGYDDAWRDLTQLLEQLFPKLAPQIKELATKEI